MRIGDVVTLKYEQQVDGDVGIVLAVDPERGVMARIYWSSWGSAMWHLITSLSVINESG